MRSMKVCVDWFQEATQEDDKNTTKKILVYNSKITKDANALMSVIAENQIEFDYVMFANHCLEKEGNTDQQVANQQFWTDLIHNQYPDIHSYSNITGVYATIPRAIEGLKEYCQQFPDHQIKVLVTGSLYLVGGVFNVLLQQQHLSPQILDL
eukprot:CAMPEP_0174271282 /NCGR_PEP_ID=MMETSP0439-20130205/47382_1 /TAXON_ID=0 /ORGANISM="Stereomyxa ramosa, Strain Chinc5" /LENGTH=151 /DNA_ID=CAMNT_0015361193 /DNA_START=138 /DNA_END=593 /DNA_ORIENTATION=-